jgi:AbrB family looped-hinge helix DNA binding protein
MTTYRTTISSKGQVIIPAELRKRLGFRKGVRAVWREDKGHLVLTTIDRILDETQGSLKPRTGQPSMFEELFEERAREREREKKKAEL